jgi:cell wall-associated NlpC family hydrolase
MLHGLVRIPVTDLRAEPDSKAERVTQALFGTPVEIRTVRKKYLKITLPDGMVGWSRTAHIEQIAFGPWRKYAGKAKAKVRSSTARVFGDDRKSQPPFILFFGTELVVSETDGKVRFVLPGGIKGFVSRSCLKMPVAKRIRGISGRQIVNAARKFLGAPYLWGGITPSGFDCSGLIQTVFGYFDIRLPRNSGDQRRKGFEVRRDNLRPGDLLFFPGHVTLSLGGSDFIHASASRGMVLIETLDPDSPDYREDLDKEFIVARRIPL